MTHNVNDHVLRDIYVLLSERYAAALEATPGSWRIEGCCEFPEERSSFAAASHLQREVHCTLAKTKHARVHPETTSEIFLSFSQVQAR